MDNLVRIQFRPWGDNLNKEQFKRFSNNVVNEHGKAFARSISEVFARWLSPGYKGLHVNPIGASGAASNSFKIIGGGGRAGFTTWEVTEGSESAKKVRVGLQPGHIVSLGTLKLWAARKGLKLLSSKEYQQKHGSKSELFKDKKWTYGKAIKISAYDSTSGKGNLFKAKEHGRSEGGKRHIVNSALKAIQNALIESGTDRPGANWMAYFPSAKGHFDYPRYLFTARKNVITDLEANHSSAIAFALASFVSSGGRVKVRDFETGGLRREARRGLF